MAEVETDDEYDGYDDNQQSPKPSDQTIKKDASKSDAGDDIDEDYEDDDDHLFADGDDNDDDSDWNDMEEEDQDQIVLQKNKPDERKNKDNTQQQSMWKCKGCGEKQYPSLICRGCGSVNQALRKEIKQNENQKEENKDNNNEDQENDDADSTINVNQNEQHQQSSTNTTITNTDTRSINVNMEQKVDNDNNNPQSESQQLIDTITSSNVSSTIIHQATNVVNPTCPAFTVDDTRSNQDLTTSNNDIMTMNEADNMLSITNIINNRRTGSLSSVYQQPNMSTTSPHQQFASLPSVPMTRIPSQQGQSRIGRRSNLIPIKRRAKRAKFILPKLLTIPENVAKPLKPKPPTPADTPKPPKPPTVNDQDNDQQIEAPSGYCAVCEQFSPAYRCAACKVIKYCTPDCQKAHWLAGHRLECTFDPTVDSAASSEESMEIKVDDNDNNDNNKPQSQSEVTHTTTSIISIINPSSTAHTMDNQNEDDAPPKTQNPFKPIELGLGYNMTTTWDSPQQFRAQSQIERRSQGRVLPKLLVNSMCVAKPPTDDNKANDQKIKTKPDSSIFGANYICSKCGLINAKYRCKECKLPRVNYCSYKCQAAHWIVHKLVCPFAKNNNRNKNNNPRRHKRRSNQRYMTREADSFMMKQSGSHKRTRSGPILLNDYMDGTRSSEDNKHSSDGSSNKSSSSIKRRSASLKRDRRKKKSRAKYQRSRSSSSGKRKLNQNQEFTEFYKRGGNDGDYEPPSTTTLDTFYRKKKPKRRRKSKKEENMYVDDEKNQNENRRGRAWFKMNEDSVSDGEYSDHHRNRKDKNNKNNKNNKNRSKSVPSSDSNKIAQWDYDIATAEFERMNPDKSDNSNNKPNTGNNHNKPSHVNFLGLISEKEKEMGKTSKKGNGDS